MNNITQIKRGSTASWSLGPEMVQWENLDVWGKDSLIHCEGTDLEMFTRTSSANYFYDENGSEETLKRPGLWLIQKGEIPTDPTKQYKVKLKTIGPPDCWLEIIDDNGVLLGQKIYLGGTGRTDEITVSNFSNFGLYIRWEKEDTAKMTAQIKLSIRQVDAYEELAPGQLGVEYTEDGKTKLKAGMPNVSKWNELPYIGNEQAIDWDIAEESNPAAIKNKPFGMVEQMVDIVPEREYDFYKPNDTTTDIVHFGAPEFNEDLFYNVWFNDIYLGTAKPGERIEIPNGQFYFNVGVMVIQGGNYPEGNYKVRITERQIVAKKLDSQWLNTQNNIYAVGVEDEPASCRGVIVAIGSLGSAVGSVRNRLDNEVKPAIGPVPTEADNGKLLQVVGGKPAWTDVEIDGGTNVLVVTAEWDEENEYYKASHTSTEIYNHVQNGGMVVFFNYNTGEFWSLQSCVDSWAQFGAVSEGNCIYTCAIDDTGFCTCVDHLFMYADATLITTDDIDAICGATMNMATLENEVTF